MNTVQTLGVFSSNTPKPATIPVDLAAVCLWSAAGLLLTAVVIACGFGTEVGQILVMAG